ncbi:MAG: hypothetical protein Q4B17_14490 [Lautropia sp.]|nr:hypothetical protein [Lautropia sp.]
MLVFATEIPVRAGSTPEDFLAVMHRWLPSIPNTLLPQDELARIITAPHGKIVSDSESVEWLTGRQAGDVLQAGVRHVRRQNQLEESTTLVFATAPDSAQLSIRVAQDGLGTTVRLPVRQKPLVVRTILDSPLGQGRDGLLSVRNTPHALSASDVELAAQLVRRESGCRLPVVYVSAMPGGGRLVDVEQLAADLAGLAHVVLEPDRRFSERLRLATQGGNIYGGSLGLYWPDDREKRAFFLGPRYATPTALADDLTQIIRSDRLHGRPSVHCDWGALHDAHIRNMLAPLRDAETEEYIETFDSEIAQLQHQLHEAQAEIEQLKGRLTQAEAGNQRQRLLLAAQAAQLESSQGSLLNPGDEVPLYANELQAILLDAVQNELDRSGTDTRRRHVLTAILAANPMPEGHPGRQLREQLKELLRDSRGLTPAVRRGLQDMGFSIHEGGKHVKLVYKGDDRYTHTLPRSGSDWRGSLNAANDIARLLF